MSQDHTRTPPRGPADERRNDPAHSERRHWDERRDERSYERSRSPRREGRGHYTDRDREGYTSPRRERSRSPYFGGAPNRNVILEGLPMEWTQEDVGRPISTSLRTFQHTQTQFYPKCTFSNVESWLSMSLAVWPLLEFTDLERTPAQSQT